MLNAFTDIPTHGCTTQTLNKVQGFGLLPKGSARYICFVNLPSLILTTCSNHFNHFCLYRGDRASLMDSFPVFCLFLFPVILVLIMDLSIVLILFLPALLVIQDTKKLCSQRKSLHIQTSQKVLLISSIA